MKLFWRAGRRRSTTYSARSFRARSTCWSGRWAMSIVTVLTDDLRISRYIDGGEIGLGDLISVSFAGDIDIGDSNRITDIRSISRARLYDGAVMIEE